MKPSRTPLNVTLPLTFNFLPAQLLTIRSHGPKWWSVVGTVGLPGLPRPHPDLSNRYMVLSDDTTAHPSDPAVAPASTTGTVLDPSPSTLPADNVTPSLRENNIQAGGPSTVRPDRRPLTKATLSSCCKKLRDAILRWSGCLPCAEPRGDPPSGLKAPGPPSHHQGRFCLFGGSMQGAVWGPLFCQTTMDRFLTLLGDP